MALGSRLKKLPASILTRLGLRDQSTGSRRSTIVPLQVCGPPPSRRQPRGESNHASYLDVELQDHDKLFNGLCMPRSERALWLARSIGKDDAACTASRLEKSTGSLIADTSPLGIHRFAMIDDYDFGMLDEAASNQQISGAGAHDLEIQDELNADWRGADSLEPDLDPAYLDERNASADLLEPEMEPPYLDDSYMYTSPSGLEIPEPCLQPSELDDHRMPTSKSNLVLSEARLQELRARPIQPQLGSALLSAAPEIRNKIYKYLYSTELYDEKESETVESVEVDLVHAAKLKPSRAFVLACRQNYAETLQMYKRANLSFWQTHRFMLDARPEWFREAVRLIKAQHPSYWWKHRLPLPPSAAIDQNLLATRDIVSAIACHLSHIKSLKVRIAWRDPSESSLQEPRLCSETLAYDGSSWLLDYASHWVGDPVTSVGRRCEGFHAVAYRRHDASRLALRLVSGRKLVINQGRNDPVLGPKEVAFWALSKALESRIPQDGPLVLSLVSSRIEEGCQLDS